MILLRPTSTSQAMLPPLFKLASSKPVVSFHTRSTIQRNSALSHLGASPQPYHYHQKRSHTTFHVYDNVPPLPLSLQPDPTLHTRNETFITSLVHQTNYSGYSINPHINDLHKSLHHSLHSLHLQRQTLTPQLISQTLPNLLALVEMSSRVLFHSRSYGWSMDIERPIPIASSRNDWSLSQGNDEWNWDLRISTKPEDASHVVAIQCLHPSVIARIVHESRLFREGGELDWEGKEAETEAQLLGMKMASQMGCRFPSEPPCRYGIFWGGFVYALTELAPTSFTESTMLVSPVFASFEPPTIVPDYTPALNTPPIETGHLIGQLMSMTCHRL